MGIRLPVVLAKPLFRQSAYSASKQLVPKGFVAVYVGEEQKKRCLVPVSYLNQPAFQDLLNLAEEEFGFIHPMGCLTIPCSQHAFDHVLSSLGR